MTETAKTKSKISSNEKLFHIATQFALPGLTISGQIAIALKLPAYGLIISLIAQPFWLYSSWKSYKDADQIGMLITSILFALITAFGVLNYWVF